MERVAFLKIEILFGEFNNTTGTSEDNETTKLFNRIPQPFKKLHSFTSKEYAYPGVNTRFGIAKGVLTSEGFVEILADKKSWTLVIFGSDPVTRKETLFHDLPPDPEDDVKSILISSQGPIELAIDADTTGEVTVEGMVIFTFCCRLDSQFAQEGSTLEVQRAFSTAAFSCKTTPTFNEPTEDISKEESLVHTHWADEDWANNKLQLNLLIRPPRFVGAVKVTMILLPSEENCARCIKGGGNASSTPFTTNTSPAGNTTL
jgi:hypothetical protein